MSASGQSGPLVCLLSLVKIWEYGFKKINTTGGASFFM